MSPFPTLQNPLLNEIIRFRAGLESVVDFILQHFSVCEHDQLVVITHLELSTLQLFSRSLESGGYGVV